MSQYAILIGTGDMPRLLGPYRSREKANAVAQRARTIVEAAYGGKNYVDIAVDVHPIDLETFNAREWKGWVEGEASHTAY